MKKFLNIRFITIAFCLLIPGIEITICTPSLVDILKEFSINVFQTEFILTFNIIAHCIAALAIGPIGDKYGHKKVVNMSFILFALSSAICAFATSYTVILIGRILQGIAVAGPAVLTPLFIFKLYKAESSQRYMLSAANGFSTIAVAFGPVIGSFITMSFGWRGGFVLLFLMSLVAYFLCYMYMPYDEKINNKIKKNENTMKGFFSIFKEKDDVIAILTCAMMIGLYFTFVGMAPIIYIQAYNVPVSQFGFHQGLLSLAFGIVSILNEKIEHLMGGKKKTFMIAVYMTIFFIITTTIIVLFNIKIPTIITINFFILSIAAVFTVNMLYVKLLTLFKDKAGQISSILTISRWFFTVIGIQISSLFYANSFRSTGVVILIMESISLLGILYIVKNSKKFAI